MEILSGRIAIKLMWIAFNHSFGHAFNLSNNAALSLCNFNRINSYGFCLPLFQVSTEHTDYVVKERITRKDPPKPAYNPMQFVQVKPCNLYQSAQEQLKKVEQIKKVKEVTKEEAEDWQSVS